MKIYTKTGDSGTTSLFGGERIAKDDVRVETYGTIDELNSWLGLIKSLEINEQHQQMLLKIQQLLFSVGSWFAASGNAAAQLRLHRIAKADIEMLETSIDAMNEKLPSLKTFVLTGGCMASGYAAVARTVCRRAERCAVRMTLEKENETELCFLNRLSDWLFVFSRLLNIESGVEEKYLPSFS